MKIIVDSEKTGALLKLVLNTFGTQNGSAKIAVEYGENKETIEAMDIAVDLKRSIVITQVDSKKTK